MHPLYHAERSCWVGLSAKPASHTIHTVLNSSLLLHRWHLSGQVVWEGLAVLLNELWWPVVVLLFSMRTVSESGSSRRKGSSWKSWERKPGLFFPWHEKSLQPHAAQSAPLYMRAELKGKTCTWDGSVCMVRVGRKCSSSTILEQTTERANRPRSWWRRAQRGPFSAPVLLMCPVSGVVLTLCRAHFPAAPGVTAPAVSEPSRQKNLLVADAALQVSGCQECLMPHCDWSAPLDGSRLFRRDKQGRRGGMWHWM